MGGKLQEELQQTKPFEHAEEEAYLNLRKTTDAMEQAFAELLKPFAISSTQYNVLRILRGAGTGGRTCREIGERLVTRDPDVTRLLDRLETRGLLTRSRDGKDRRVIMTCITEAGLHLLAELDEPLLARQRAQLGHLGPARLRTLIDLLELARSGSPEQINQ